MIARVLATVGVLVGALASADACPPNRPCKKNMARRIEKLEPVGYTREMRGAVPRWQRERIETFLVDSAWIPLLPGGKRWALQKTPNNEMPDPIEFVPTERADELANAGTYRKVLVREIQRRSGVILVEIDGDPWKLAACPRKPGFACLLPAGKLTFEVVQ